MLSHKGETSQKTQFDKSSAQDYHVGTPVLESVCSVPRITGSSCSGGERMCWIRSRTVYAAILNLLLLAGVVLRVASFTWNTRLQGDVNLFALTAREFVQHDRLYYPMKYEFSDHVPYKTLASPASQHPPLWSFAAGLLGKILHTEDTFPLLKLLSEVNGIGLLVLVAYIGWRRKQPVATLIAVTLLTLSPVLVDYSANGSPYILSATLLVLAALLMALYRPQRLADHVLAGVLCGLALQVHSVMILLPAAFLIFWWRVDGRLPWRGVIVSALAGVVTLLPWMLWNYFYFGRPFYSYSTYHFLKQFGLARVAMFDNVITTHIVRSPDMSFLGDYLRAVRDTVLVSAQNYYAEIGPFGLVLLAVGWVGLFRYQRRVALASFLPFLFYTLTVFLWATAHHRFLVPIIPLTYLVAAVGFVFLRKDRLPWRVLGWICLAGTIAWTVVGYRDQPPTRYYQYDAEWAATYAKMLPLAQELGERERGVVLSYAYILDGGIETVYWDRQPFVYGRELPPEALSKVIEDFGVRYLWTQADMSEDLLTRFPRAREILVNDVFHVLELPAFDLVPLTPEQQVAAVRTAGQPDPAVLAPLASTAVRPIEDQVWFRDQIRLVGSAVEPWEGDLLVDLVWATTAPKLAAVQYFVHVTDAQGNLVAQRDGPLGRWPDEPESVWTAGSLLRQRIRLRVPSMRPGAATGSYQIYVRLYTPQTVERLPLKVNGAATPEDRYLLPLENNGAPGTS
jgi:hypothetical protein